ncbi:MAG TPA: hypothetical protein VJV21_08650 [Pyrinomonadaceae bacterium]|nr:hypothetical protein [Pyrinomonadaceae bacterium]
MHFADVGSRRNFASTDRPDGFVGNRKSLRNAGSSRITVGKRKIELGRNGPNRVAGFPNRVALANA